MKKTKKQLPADAVEVARVAGAWGIKGDIKIIPYDVDADALFNAEQWFILPADQQFAPKLEKSAANPGKQVAFDFPIVLEDFELREHRESLIINMPQVTDRDVAQSLKGARIFVSRADFPELEDGAFYWVDLIGLEVENLQGEKLGTVEDLMSTSAQTILRIPYRFISEKGIEREAEHLIPFVDAYVTEVDLKAKKIKVDWQSSFSL